MTLYIIRVRTVENRDDYSNRLVPKTVTFQYVSYDPTMYMFMLLFCSYGAAIDVEYHTPDGRYVIDYKGDRITGEKFPGKTTYLNIRKYKNESEIIEIKNFGELSAIRMTGIGQKMIPTFEGVPKVELLLMNKNRLEGIERDRISNVGFVNINLNNNRIGSVDSGAFGGRVQRLWLACNRLDSFSSEWFKNPEVLEEIDLSGNFFTRLPDDSFMNFPGVYNILFNHNGLKEIGRGSFGNRESFNQLHISYNELFELNPGVFHSDNVTIGWFSISNNRISELSEDLRKKLTIVSIADLGGNPWNSWDVIEKWLPESTILLNQTDSYQSNYCADSSTIDDSGIW